MIKIGKDMESRKCGNSIGKSGMKFPGWLKGGSLVTVGGVGQGAGEGAQMVLGGLLGEKKEFIDFQKHFKENSTRRKKEAINKFRLWVHQEQLKNASEIIR